MLIHDIQPPNNNPIIKNYDLAFIESKDLEEIEEIQNLSLSLSIENKIAAIAKALNYQESGWQLIIKAFDDNNKEVQACACLAFQSQLQLLFLLSQGVEIWNKWKAITVRLNKLVDLSGVDLSEGYFPKINLHRVNLEKANLVGTNFSGGFLHQANLKHANLTGANLSNTDLYKTDLSWANLMGADLTRADLSWANLKGANLLGADLSEADLRGNTLDSYF